MKKNFTLLLVLCLQLNSKAGVNEVVLSGQALGEVIESSAFISSIPGLTPEKINSVASLYPEISHLTPSDLNTLYSFTGLQLIPGISIEEEKEAFIQCAPFTGKYIDQIKLSFPSIVEKYPGPSEAILVNTLNVFFQRNLYRGLRENDRIDLLSEIPGHEILIEVLGTVADNMIYFTVSHSFRNLFTLVIKEYETPIHDYSDD